MTGSWSPNEIKKQAASIKIVFFLLLFECRALVKTRLRETVDVAPADALGLMKYCLSHSVHKLQYFYLLGLGSLSGKDMLSSQHCQEHATMPS